MSELDEILRGMTERQIAFVAIRVSTATDQEAAQQAGIPEATVKGWKYEGGVRIDDAVRLLRLDSIAAARELLQRLGSRAVQVLMDEMSPGKRKRLQAAVEVLDRVGLVPGSTVDAGDNLAALLRQWHDVPTDAPQSQDVTTQPSAGQDEAGG